MTRHYPRWNVSHDSNLSPGIDADGKPREPHHESWLYKSNANHIVYSIFLSAIYNEIVLPGHLAKKIDHRTNFLLKKNSKVRWPFLSIQIELPAILF